MLVDALIIAFVGTFVWRGLRRGLLLSLTGLVGFVLAAVAAVLGFRVVGSVLEGMGISPGVANLFGGLAIFLAVTIGMEVAGRALTRALRWTKLGALNTAGGGAIACAWALSWVMGVLLAISVLPVPESIASGVDSSTIGKGIVREAPRWARAVARSDLRRMLTLFVPSDREVALVATGDFHRVADAERGLFELVNEEREIEGLRALVWDETLAVAGRRHAADMYRNGFFSHRSAGGATPGDRIRAAGGRFSVVAENLALAATLRIAHAQLMASDRHRRHILGTRFVRLGIGVMYGRQGLLIAQEFAG